jgi:hypothetical protein
MRSAALILLIIASLNICTVFSEATEAHEEWYALQYVN